MLNKYLQKHAELVGLIQNDSALKTLWQEADELLFSTLSNGNCVFIAGNGGSAADAQHFAAEIVGRFEVERRGYPAVALTTDTSILTAVGNDYGFGKIFSRQLSALAKEGDCFVGITTSGNSENILEALQVAKEIGVKTILLTGRDGGKAKILADIPLVIPCESTSHIQEVHSIFYHAWCASLDKKLES